MSKPVGRPASKVNKQSKLIAKVIEQEIDIEFDEDQLPKLIAKRVVNVNSIKKAKHVALTHIPIPRPLTPSQILKQTVQSSRPQTPSVSRPQTPSVSRPQSPRPSTPLPSKTKLKITKKTIVKKPVVKKGPGRPRKVPKKDPIQRKGIVSEPMDADSAVEFLYDSPMYLRKAVLFFKSLAAANIQMLFLPDKLIMYAPDHYNKTYICVTFFTSKINRYYCRHPLNIGASTKDLEAITSSIDKDYSSVILLLTNSSAQKNLTMILQNDIHIDEMHSIDLIAQYDQMVNENEFLDENYTIQFEWPSKYFKKTIGDIKSISKTLYIVKSSNDADMEIQYISSNKKIHSTHVVKNAERIKLVSNMVADESFRIGIHIDYIKPISSAHIADEITILVDEKKRLMTKAYIDDYTIEIKTLTEIIDERPV